MMAQQAVAGGSPTSDAQERRILSRDGLYVLHEWWAMTVGHRRPLTHSRFAAGSLQRLRLNS